MLNRAAVLVPVFLALQAGLVYSVTFGERPPAAPDLTAFPAALAGWEKIREDPIEPDVAALLGADRLLNWTYLRPPSNVGSNLFVAWFQSLRGGASQPHSPQVCLPGSGWTSVVSEEIPLDTPAGTIPVRHYVISRGPERAVVLYWYQSPRRVVANEWAAKFWVMADAARDRRTDTALVRVVVWNGGQSDEETTSTAKGFARAAYPVLRGMLPR